MSVPTHERADDDRVDARVWKMAGVVALGPLMTNLDSTIVNVSLSALGRDLHASLTTIAWVTSAYLLSLALVLPLSGWLVDRIGAKRVYLYCFSAFTAASLLCGLATSATGLIVFRILQGAAGGLLAPMAQMMAARIAGRHVARVLGISVMPVMIGPILGPALAGLILQHAGWRWIFFVNLPVGILSTFLAWYVLPRDTDETNPRSFDLVGFLLLSPGLALLVHGLERLGSSDADVRSSVLEVGVAVALLAAFVVHALRLGTKAIVDLRLFKRLTFSTAAATQFLSNCVMFGGQMLLPLFLLDVAGKSPSDTGILLAPMGVGMMFAYPLMGTLTERFGPRSVSAGGALLALLGTLPFASSGAASFSMPLLCAVFFVRGAGLGCINIPSISAAYATIPKANIPVATTAINIVQRLGGPIATTFLAIYLHSEVSAPNVTESSAYAITFRVLCILHVACAVTAMRLPGRSAQTSSLPEAVAPALGE